jgi:hypothetical protein
MTTASEVVAAATQKVVMDAYDVTTIINNLNTLYSNTIGQVITYTAIIIGLVGIVIPTLATLYQWRSLKAEKKSLEKDIKEGIDNAKVDIRNALIAEMKEQIAIEENALTSRMQEKFDELDSKIECSKASVFFLQGKSHLGLGLYAAAIKDYCIAAESFIVGKDELNGQTALATIIENCLPKVHQADYEEQEIEEKIKALIKYLSSGKVNENSRYQNNIDKLKAESKLAKTREPTNAQ